MPVLTVTGSLLVRDASAVPPGAVATVKVVDDAGEVLAATALEVEQLPARFSVTLDDQMVTGDLFVWALLRADDDGWGTLELVPADLGTVELNRIGD
jgi:putative lipoprotein